MTDEFLASERTRFIKMIADLQKVTESMKVEINPVSTQSSPWVLVRNLIDDLDTRLKAVENDVEVLKNGGTVPTSDS